jgi:hypothetical protein
LHFHNEKATQQGEVSPDSGTWKAKNGAENGGRKREPKEETDSFPWKSAKKTEEKPNHNRQALPSGMAD